MTSGAQGPNTAGTNSFSYTSAALPATCHCPCWLMPSNSFTCRFEHRLRLRHSNFLFGIGNPFRDTLVHRAPNSLRSDLPPAVLGGWSRPAWPLNSYLAL